MKPFSLVRDLHCVTVLSCALVCLVSTAAPLASQSPASTLVQQAVQAMGGEGTIRAVKTVKIEAMAHLFALEQSERPEGPYLVTYQQTSEVRDQERQRLLRKAEQRNWSLPNWSGPTLVADQGVVALSMNGRWGPHLPEQLGLVQHDLELAPERLLLTALSAVDLRTAPDRTIHGIRNQSVMFTHRDVTYTLYLSSQTSMPTMLQSLKDDSFGVWGDVTEERWFDPRMSQVVELRFFGGLSVEETADVLDVSPETVMRDWKTAKAWLLRELSQGNPQNRSASSLRDS